MINKLKNQEKLATSNIKLVLLVTSEAQDKLSIYLTTGGWGRVFFMWCLWVRVCVCGGDVNRCAPSKVWWPWMSPRRDVCWELEFAEMVDLTIIKCYISFTPVNIQYVSQIIKNIIKKWFLVNHDKDMCP